jgi:hypothetical protein
MPDSTTTQTENTPKPAKHNRTMVVTLVVAFLGFVALIVFNMK